MEWRTFAFAVGRAVSRSRRRCAASVAGGVSDAHGVVSSSPRRRTCTIARPWVPVAVRAERDNPLTRPLLSKAKTTIDTVQKEPPRAAEASLGLAAAPKRRRARAGVGALLAGALALASSCTASVPPHRTGGAHKLTADAPGDPAHNLLKQSRFEEGSMLPWMTSFGNGAVGEAEVKDGALCLQIEQPGKERWDAQVRHREFALQQGHTYTVSFKAWSSRPTKGTLKVGMSGPPYTDDLTRLVQLDTQPQEYAYEFTMSRPDDATAEMAWHLGGLMFQGQGPLEVCFDDIILSDPQFTPPPPEPVVEVPRVRVNQVGYLPGFAKFASVISDAQQALTWELRDAAGAVVAKGETQPFGADPDSGDSVHWIDFSSYSNPGRDYVLVVGEYTSDAFDIAAELYTELKAQAFKYFYRNRSGIELRMPWVGDAAWARPAGHAPDVAPCAPDTDCKYELDVTGGWYDAGDYGKYVVNGGISVWTLMNLYERALHAKGDVNAFGDETNWIPESGNKVPDVLDEARWQMEFMLRMQVPEGQPLAGMVHHKIHDAQWTALGLRPDESQVPRYLRPPSTAATLNLAATAAQAARLWKQLDPAFSQRCLHAAERAWQAAKQHPDRFAPKEDTVGGGPYDDQNVSDEFYWAAAELFITTGQDEYRETLRQSPHDREIDAATGGDGGGTLTAMTWQRVDTLGVVSLALVPSKLEAAERERHRARLLKLADVYAGLVSKQGYRVPLKAGESGYPWGSNSSVLNNILVLALAHDFAPKDEYRDAVVMGLDYLLGRNALGKSYITGFGERPLENPHHRFWAHQANPNYPKPPPGAVSGGPNSGLQDPYARAAGLKGCAPQKCFIDHIESWSTNEITINWNAPLTWVVSWLDEQARRTQ